MAVAAVDQTWMVDYSVFRMLQILCGSRRVLSQIIHPCTKSAYTIREDAYLVVVALVMVLEIMMELMQVVDSFHTLQTLFDKDQVVSISTSYIVWLLMVHTRRRLCLLLLLLTK